MSNESQTYIKVDESLHQPPMYRIIFVNDDRTPFEYVTSSIMGHFKYTAITASNIAQEIHNKGEETVAILPFEIAEQKGVEITTEARGHGFPLRVRLAPDEPIL
mgnify:CR=1 FL=1|jgi:ATP-dependent Clp protease adaptor protein ClpS